MTTCTSSRALAEIDVAAFISNLKLAASLHSGDWLLPVIKANGYGHGLETLARALRGCIDVPLTGVAVASLAEARQLRENDWTLPIVLLPGYVTAQECEQGSELLLDPIVHSLYQLDLILASNNGQGPQPQRVWLKANTGMNRLGLNAKDWHSAYEQLQRVDIEIVAMSHLACADELESSMTRKQQGCFETLLAGSTLKTPRSLAASGGVLAWPKTHYDIARPGIMLYGSSPFAQRSAHSLGLKPVMTLRSRLLAINSINKGDTVGYGATFTADRNMRLGIVSIGYGDGYPRKAPTGTPVLVHTQDGPVRSQLVGRVSMDMITIDLTDISAAIDDTVVLWGEGLPADEIAELCGTIAYELFCQVTPRVPRIVKGAECG